MQKPLFKSFVGNPFTEVPKNPKSHVRGWAQHWADMLGAEVLNKDESLDGVHTFFLDHGVNSVPGQMNLFGGVTDQIVDRIEQIVSNPDMAVVSLDVRMPVDEYISGLEKRIGQSTCSPRLTPQLIGKFRQRLLRDEELYMMQADFVENSVCVGDSHSTAYAEKRQPVLRTNGLTLHGALKSGVFEKAAKLLKPGGKMTVVAGSVDIRHHIGLKSNPEYAAEMLASDLTNEVIRLQDLYGISVEVGLPVPIEYEGRRIPKSGWLNGKPFCGSRTDRDIWNEAFHYYVSSAAEQYDFSIVSPPLEWYDMDPEQYAKEYMELSSSVHISPTHYRSKGGWHVQSN